MKKICIYYRDPDAGSAVQGHDSTVFADSKSIEILKIEFDDYALNAESLINELYSLINSIDNNWSGEVATAFVEKCNTYRSALDGYSALLKTISKQLDDISGESETLRDTIVNLCSGGGK